MYHPSRRRFLRDLGFSLTAALLPSRVLRAAPARQPNVVLFLVDDMGWMDTTVNGSKYYDTPNMERLAARSMRFTDAYTASPLCSPTRASIMTGKYPARTGITTAVGHRPPLPEGTSLLPETAAPNRPVLLPQSRRYLEPKEYTIAEALRDAGYRTAHIGKWHLGLNPEHWPEQQGFDVSFHGAPDPGPRSYHSPYQFAAGTVTDGPEGEYITDRVTDEALKFIEANRARPFYLNLWHYAVHGPWGHKEEITKRYVDRKDPRGEQDNPIMASMLKSVDESLGRVLDRLDKLGLTENTIFIFFSDNGGNVHSNTETDQKRAPEGSRRWTLQQDWRKWAGHSSPTNNAPLRLGKGWIYEGGIRVPMMLYWPGVVERKTTCNEVVCSVDLYPTVLEMLGLKRNPEQVMDGESIVPLLKGTGTLQRDAVFFYFPHGGPTRPAGVAVRQGDWKLIRWFETSDMDPEQFELYNLRQDIGEEKNLAQTMPDKVKALDAMIDKHLADTGAAAPKPNPAYNPRTRPIDGWQPVNKSTLTQKDGVLVIHSDEIRTQMHTRQVPSVAGQFTVKVRMRADKGGNGILYWASKQHPQHARERRVDFKTEFDGTWKEYDLEFDSETPLTGLRFDGSVVPTTLEVDWFELRKRDGTVLKRWDFGE